MALRLLPALFLALAAGLSSCADHSSVQGSAIANNPPPPTSQGDDQLMKSPTGSPAGNNNNGNQGGSNQGGSPLQPQPHEPSPVAGQPVPEPTTFLLVGTGLAGAALLGRRRRNAAQAS